MCYSEVIYYSTAFVNEPLLCTLMLNQLAFCIKFQQFKP